MAKTIEIEANDYVVDGLVFLARHGAFGEDIEDVAELLLREKLRELERQGWLNPNVKRRVSANG